MPSTSRILVLAALLSLSNSLPWPASNPASNPASSYDQTKRDSLDTSTCGWVGGDFSRPVTCSSGSQCVYDSLHQVVGCCPTSGACTTGVYTSCTDANNPKQNAADSGVLTCSSGSACYQDTYPGGYRRYGCGAYSDAKSVATAYIGQDPTVTLPVVFTALAFTATGAGQPISSSSMSSSPSYASSSTTSSSTSFASSSSTGASPSHMPSSSSSSTRLASSTSLVPTLTSSLRTTFAVAEPTLSSAIGGTVSSAASTSSPSAAATAQGIQGQIGIIAGSVIGGLAAVLALVALACFFVRKRQRIAKKHLRSFPDKKDNMSISSSGSSEVIQVHYFSPDDISVPLRTSLQPPSPSRLPIVPLEAPIESQTGGQHSASRAIVSDVITIPNIDTLASLPEPWVRPPTPPPRSPKRLQRQSEQAEPFKQSEDSEKVDKNKKVQSLIVERIAPLQLYHGCELPSLLRSSTVLSNSSDSSHYSRATDGHSEAGSRRGRKEWSAMDTLPKPIARKPVGTGWYRTPSIVVEEDYRGHIGYHVVDGATIERDSIGLPQTRGRSGSGTATVLPSDVTTGNPAGLSTNVSDGRQELDAIAVAPLRLKAHRESAVQKGGSPLVPILSVPAAPSPGDRERRLYDIR